MSQKRQRLPTMGNCVAHTNVVVMNVSAYHFTQPVCDGVVTTTTAESMCKSGCQTVDVDIVVVDDAATFRRHRLVVLVFVVKCFMRDEI